MGALFGWAGRKVADQAYEAHEKEFVPFRSGAGGKTEEYLWRYIQRVNNGEHWKWFPQEIGDCVSFAGKHAGMCLTAYQICERGDSSKMRDWFPPYLYGMSRNAPDCGAGQLGRNDGSVGAWLVIALQNYGVLFDDDKNVPKYSGTVAKQWGVRGVPKEYQTIASDNPVKSSSRLTSASAVRDAILSGCPVIIGSDWGFRAIESDGYVQYTRNGTWGHEMAIIGWKDDPYPMCFRQNSWFPLIDDSSSSKGLQLTHGEPSGGAWYRADYLDKEIRSGAECYSMNHFTGDASVGRHSFI